MVTVHAVQLKKVLIVFKEGGLWFMLTQAHNNIIAGLCGHYSGSVTPSQPSVIIDLNN